ncbi:MAG TPA: DUF350 domain-containing protein [Thermoanaerobaculia bacterium]|nr:DUF350 domain-containing protein [Thermoanaerobaculia bacterium]
MDPVLRLVLSTIGWTLFGIVVFGLAFWGMVKVTPFSIRKEIETDQNTAVAIIIAAVILGLAIIIASVLHG